VSNTVAIIDNESQPARSRYLTTEANGRVEPFINLTGDELAIEERDDDMRVALWAFGGVVEMEDGTGRVWFSKQLAHKNGLMEYIGTGLAKVTPRLNGHLRVQRSPEMVFGPHDAKIGTFSGIKVGDYIYLYGDSGNNQIVLSRVLADPDREDIIYDKYSYTYWNGSNYVLDPKEAKVVFQGLSQGSVVRTKLFGPGKPYLFVGVGAWGSSKIMMGASASLEGPWDLKEVYATEGINIKDKYRYCMYPHVWASDEEKAELVVSWCEPYPGGVIMARLQLAPVVDTVEEG